MIYIHTYGIGKFGSKQIRNIHDTKESAERCKAVLGGEVQEFECVDDLAAKQYHIEQVLLSELSELIDNMSNHSPGSQLEEPGSPEWDCAKVKTINLFSDIFNGKFDEIE